MRLQALASMQNLAGDLADRCFKRSRKADIRCETMYSSSYVWHDLFIQLGGFNPRDATIEMSIVQRPKPRKS